MKTLALWCAASVMLMTIGGCRKHQPAASSGKKTSLPKIEACSLLTADEIQQVQSAPLKDSQSTETANGQVRVSQCYFAAEPAHLSVALTVIQPDPAGGLEDAAKRSWQDSFSRANQAESESESEGDREKRESLREHRRGEEQEEARPLKRIEGIGDEAFWAGSRVGGSLYVLKGDVYIRMSLGGSDTENDKIEKTKRLAAKALQRLK